jgi:cytochrome c oxidase assembly protein subunit 15
MGGLVTTKGAGMAVPDWPTTYESWFYPLQKWLWKTSSDLFLEHGHRTLAQLVGIFAIALVISVFRSEQRKSIRVLSFIILAGLLFQGTLGGFRVLWDERLLARIHGCTAPIVFCLCWLMATFTSKAWQNISGMEKFPAAKALARLSPLVAGLAYLEIVFGTLLRHPLIDAWTSWTLVWIWCKVITVGILFLGILALLFLAFVNTRDVPTLRRRIFFVSSLFALQIILAAATWVVNYGWPQWFIDYFFAWTYSVDRGGLLQVWITTAHAAVGSLVLVSAVNLAVWSWRLFNICRSAESRKAIVVDFEVDSQSEPILKRGPQA